MEKEKVLELSRKENKPEDERGMLLDKKCYANAFFGINAFCVLYVIYSYVRFKESNEISQNIFGVVFLGMFAYEVSKFYYMRKPIHLAAAVLFAFVSIAYLYFLFTGSYLLH